MSELANRCRALIAELGLAEGAEVGEIVPLTGGVASDIARVSLSGRQLCVKFALPKLKVAADWRAPVHRNAAEYAWLELASKVLPDSAVELYGRSESHHGFAMEFLEGADVYLWKAAMLQCARDGGEAKQVADMLGRIHAASTQAGFDDAPFQNADDFRALRLEPYLNFTATRHPGVGARIDEFAAMLYRSRQVLIHGDVSPKNILFRRSGPVLLDAECATMGDACFDPSFCLNHLVLKAVHLPGLRRRLLQNAADFWTAYSGHVIWEKATGLEKRMCLLLPMLMLARVDGKSPVEYLGEAERSFVRRVAIGLISDPVDTIGALVSRILNETEEFSGDNDQVN